MGKRACNELLGLGAAVLILCSLGFLCGRIYAQVAYDNESAALNAFYSQLDQRHDVVPTDALRLREIVQKAFQTDTKTVPYSRMSATRQNKLKEYLNRAITEYPTGDYGTPLQREAFRGKFQSILNQFFDTPSYKATDVAAVAEQCETVAKLAINTMTQLHPEIASPQLVSDLQQQLMKEYKGILDDDMTPALKNPLSREDMAQLAADYDKRLRERDQQLPKTRFAADKTEGLGKEDAAARQLAEQQMVREQVFGELRVGVMEMAQKSVEVAVKHGFVKASGVSPAEIEQLNKLLASANAERTAISEDARKKSKKKWEESTRARDLNVRFPEASSLLDKHVDDTVSRMGTPSDRSADKHGSDSIAKMAASRSRVNRAPLMFTEEGR